MPLSERDPLRNPGGVRSAFGKQQSITSTLTERAFDGQTRPLGSKM